MIIITSWQLLPSLGSILFSVGSKTEGEGREKRRGEGREKHAFQIEEMDQILTFTS